MATHVRAEAHGAERPWQGEGRDNPTGVAQYAGVIHPDEQQGEEKHTERGLSHGASIARWRTLRCQVCRRPLQRALLVAGSAVQATCRRDRATFVYVATEAGLLVMRREQ